MAACEYVPSLHAAVAPVESLSLALAVFVAGADLAAVFAAAGAAAGGAVFAADLLAAVAGGVAAGGVAVFAADAAFFAAAVAFASTPPWPEHAPLPDVAEVVPSLQTLAVPCALRRLPETPSASTTRAAERKERFRM